LRPFCSADVPIGEGALRRRGRRRYNKTAATSRRSGEHARLGCGARRPRRVRSRENSPVNSLSLLAKDLSGETPHNTPGTGVLPDPWRLGWHGSRGDDEPSPWSRSFPAPRAPIILASDAVRRHPDIRGSACAASVSSTDVACPAPTPPRLRRGLIGRHDELCACQRVAFGPGGISELGLIVSEPRVSVFPLIRWSDSAGVAFRIPMRRSVAR
jgi:hypothetical protein